MNHTIAAVFGITLAIGVVLALQAQASEHSFGSVNCRPKVPCIGSESSDMSYSQNAATCLAESFGIRSSEGYFDGDNFDDHNCLILKPGIGQTPDSKAILPTCCLMELPDNTCQLHCEVFSH